MGHECSKNNPNLLLNTLTHIPINVHYYRCTFKIKFDLASLETYMYFFPFLKFYSLFSILFPIFKIPFYFYFYVSFSHGLLTKDKLHSKQNNKSFTLEYFNFIFLTFLHLI